MLEIYSVPNRLLAGWIIRTHLRKRTEMRKLRALRTYMHENMNFTFRTTHNVRTHTSNFRPKILQI